MRNEKDSYKINKTVLKRLNAFPYIISKNFFRDILKDIEQVRFISFFDLSIETIFGHFSFPPMRPTLQKEKHCEAVKVGVS